MAPSNVNPPIPSYEEAVVASPSANAPAASPAVCEPTRAERRPSEPEATSNVNSVSLPPELPPAYAVVDEKATTFTIYGTFIHTPNAPAYQLSSLLDACINKLRLRRLRAEEVTRLQSGATNIPFTNSGLLYEAHDPPFLVNEYYVQGKSASALPGFLQLRFGLRRWHIAHIPSQGSRPIEIMTCGKLGGFTKAIKQRKNEMEPSEWKDSEGNVVATEVLKMGYGGKMPTIELRSDLDQTCRELILALWVTRLWAAFGAGRGYMT